MSQLTAHPVAEIFPAMPPAEFCNLEADIREHGLREPIWLHRDGRIIDGRNRYRACLEAGVEPTFRTYEGAGGDSNLIAFVLSLNLHRRHLTESQRAMVASKVANLGLGANQHAQQGVQLCTPSPDPLFGTPDREVPAAIPAVSLADAAGMLSVSRRSAASARRVQEHGIPELVAKVEAGEIAVSAAETIAKAPPEEQREVASLADRRQRRERERDIERRAAQEQARRNPAPKALRIGELLPSGDVNRRRQDLNLAVGKLQAAYRALADFSAEEVAFFVGENPSMRQILAFVHEQHMSWFDTALADRSALRAVEGGSSS